MAKHNIKQKFYEAFRDNIGKEYEDKKSLDEYFETIIPIIKELKRVLKKEIRIRI